MYIGMGGSIAFASPSHQLTFAHVVNQLDASALAVDPRSTRLFQPIEDILKEQSAS